MRRAAVVLSVLAALALLGLSTANAAGQQVASNGKNDTESKDKDDLK